MIRHRFSSIGLFSAAAVTAFGFVLCGSLADAQVVRTLGGTVTGALTGNTFNYALQDSTSNAIVMATYADAGGPITMSNAMFAGAAATEVMTNDRVNVAYWFNPATTGAVTFDLSAINTASNAVGWLVYEVKGVVTSTAVDWALGNANGATGTITTTTPNKFLINFFGHNNSAGAVTTPAAGAIQKKFAVQNANGGAGGGSIVSGISEGRTTGAAGAKTVGWALNGEGQGNGMITIGIDAPPPVLPLTLEINKSTGEVKIRNKTDNPISFDYYLVTSPNNMLDTSATGWNSLDDKNFDTGLPADFDNSGAVDRADLIAWRQGFGAPGAADANLDGKSDGNDFLSWQRSVGKTPGSGDGWIEAGGSNAREVGELFLNVGSTLKAHTDVSLGFLYNEALTPGVNGDLSFTVSTANSDTLFQGVVEYIPSATAAGSAVPEPTAAVLCLAVLGALSWKRRLA